MLPFITWWLIIQLFGLAALPLTRKIFRWLPDCGYAFSKAIGLLLVSYLLWLGAMTGVLVNDPGGITLALLAVAGVSGWVVLNRGWETARDQFRIFWTEERSRILAAEALFLLSFAGWALIRAYAPDKIQPAGGEKYMEIAFLNGVLNSPRFPPIDPWLSGYGISYYYFGYVMMAVMTRLSGVLPTVGFDLYDALTFALSILCAYGLVSNMVALGGGSRREAGVSGLLGGLFVVVSGNLEGFIHALYSARVLPESFLQWLAIPGLLDDAQTGSLYPGHGWWWWRASRILNDLDLNGQPVLYQPIDEFPFFSFLLGDNHPHKLALPFVLLAAGLALNLLIYARTTLFSRAGQTRSWQPWKGWTDLRKSDLVLYLFTVLVLGGLAFLNTWDFPVYLDLTLLAYAVGKVWGGEPLHFSLLWKTLRLAVLLAAGAVLFYIFFYLGFSSQAGGILPYIFPPTRLAQYLVMFGPFVFILGVFLFLAVLKTGKETFPWQESFRMWIWTAGLCMGVYLVGLLLGIAALSLLAERGQAPGILLSYLGGRSGSELFLTILLSRIKNPWLFLLLTALLALALTGIQRATRRPEPFSIPTVFALLLAFAGIALTFSMEFFYLRDQFGMRMNTIFKFYYQGWVMLGCASAYAVWWISRQAGPTGRAVFGLATGLLVGMGLVYPLMGSYSRVEGFQYAPDLDSAATVAGRYPDRWAAQPDDWAAIEWMRGNAQMDDGALPVILEAPGESYQHTSRVSAFTGFPTLLGWKGHEGQWRGSDKEEKLREPVIRGIYSTSSGSQALEALQDWQVRYVILGEGERRYIEEICRQKENPCNPRRALEKFDEILTPVFEQGSVLIYAVPQ